MVTVIRPSRARCVEGTVPRQKRAVFTVQGEGRMLAIAAVYRRAALTRVTASSATLIFGRASRMDRGDARELPIPADRSDKRRARQSVVADVLDFQSTSMGVAQQEVRFSGSAAEI